MKLKKNNTNISIHDVKKTSTVSFLVVPEGHILEIIADLKESGVKFYDLTLENFPDCAPMDCLYHGKVRSFVNPVGIASHLDYDSLSAFLKEKYHTEQNSTSGVCTFESFDALEKCIQKSYLPHELFLGSGELYHLGDDSYYSSL